MSAAYSAMVRSLENFPELAMVWIAMMSPDVPASGTNEARETPIGPTFARSRYPPLEVWLITMLRAADRSAVDT
jgi:hypothetical protein